MNVDEVDVAQLAEGQPAISPLTPSRVRRWPGTVTYIAPSSTNVGGAVAYAVEISFRARRRLPVRLGMTADVDIVVASAEDALLVPNQAIEADREAGRYYVTRQTARGTHRARRGADRPAGREPTPRSWRVWRKATVGRCPRCPDRARPGAAVRPGTGGGSGMCGGDG